MKSQPSTYPFGEAIAALRKRAGVGVRQLAREAGISHVLLVNIESGKRQAGIGTAIKLTGALGLPHSQRAKLLHDYLQSPRGELVPSLLAEALRAVGLDAVASGGNLEVDMGGGLKVQLEAHLTTS